MALHGTVEINGDTLWTWSARRLSRLPESENEYEVSLYAPNGESVKDGTLSHVYDDGAVVLAAKVLAWASGEAPAAPLDALSVACPWCSAACGKPCRLRDGTPAYKTHSDRRKLAAGQAPAHTSLSAEKAQIVADERDRIWAGVDELDGQALSGVSYVDEAAVYAVIYPKEAPAAPLIDGNTALVDDSDKYGSGEAPAAPGEVTP